MTKVTNPNISAVLEARVKNKEALKVQDTRPREIKRNKF